MKAKVKIPRITRKGKIDQRSMTSAINGLKGGRKKASIDLEIVFKKEEILKCIHKDYYTDMMEAAFQKALPDEDVCLITAERLEKTPNYVYNTKDPNLVTINNHPLPFNPQMDYFLKIFVKIFRGNKDFYFKFTVPTSAL